jgi:hypothetical protein
MIKITRTFTVALVVSVAPLLFAAQPVSVALSIEPSRTIQGIPISLHVTAENTTDQEVVLPKKALLRVIPAEGEPFIAEWGFSQEHRFSRAELPGDEAALRLAPHSSRTFAFNAESIYGTGWSVDPRWQAPGRYRLQLLLTDRITEEVIFHTHAMQLESAIGPTLVSTEAVLTVEAPQGDDAILWRLLSEPARRRSAPWSTLYVNIHDLSRFATEAMEHYPGSRYAPYVVQDAIGIPLSRRLDDARRVLEAQPAAPIRDYAQFFVARLERMLAGDPEARANLKLAIDLTERARADYAAIERSTSNPELRQTSRVEREKLPTIEELQARIHPQPPSDQ